MAQGNFIEDMAKRLTDMMPNSVREAQKDLEKNIHAMMKAGFAKLDLVTREEFDVQTKVLEKTRHKLEALEKQIATLEKKSHSARAKTTVKSH